MDEWTAGWEKTEILRTGSWGNFQRSEVRGQKKERVGR